MTRETIKAFKYKYITLSDLGIGPPLALGNEKISMSVLPMGGNRNANSYKSSDVSIR